MQDSLAAATEVYYRAIEAEKVALYEHRAANRRYDEAIPATLDDVNRSHTNVLVAITAVNHATDAVKAAYRDEDFSASPPECAILNPAHSPIL